MRRFFILLFFCIPFVNVWAAGEFRADYDVHYGVSPQGTTIVTQNISLTNKLTNLYPKQYAILIDSPNIKNVIATDSEGIITPVINIKEGKTEIILDFNAQVVGIGKTLPFTLRYEHSDVAHKLGRIWEITIPGVSDDPDLGTYDVRLSVPSSFGPASYLTPPPGPDGLWEKDQLVKGGISGAFGTEQVFGLSLSYFLANTAVTRQKSSIALPPSTAFQNVILENITPQPVAVRTDKDGNWLAEYSLGPGEEIHIAADLRVVIFLDPKKDFRQEIRPEDYLRPLPYWEAYDGKIIALASSNKTPRQIYDYVVSTLSYSYERVEQSPIRKGAKGALGSPKQAVCMEFTDLFIAIARAAGIPARQAVGFAYTTNSRLRPLSLVSDVLHAWPEYYDETRGIWIPVDPTWASTTGGVNYFDRLDFNHIVFAYNGLSSETPYPAGFYRKADKVGKDVLVEFSTQLPRQSQQELAVSFDGPKRVTAGFPFAGTITIRNTGGESIEKLEVFAQTSQGWSIAKTSDQVPPYGVVEVPVNATTDGFFDSHKGRLVVLANGQTAEFPYDVTPFYVRIAPGAIGAGGLGIIGWLLWKARHKSKN